MPTLISGNIIKFLFVAAMIYIVFVFLPLSVEFLGKLMKPIIIVYHMFQYLSTSQAVFPQAISKLKPGWRLHKNYRSHQAECLHDPKFILAHFNQGM